jgi:alkylation response protein AidB-like acyl-CoA dehydrogenase
MEKQTEILVIVAHEGILSTILRLINKEQSWHASGAQSIAGAKELLTEDTALVLLGSGLTEEEEQEMIDHLTIHYKSAKTIRHFGGGSGLLYAEIYQALARR